MLHHEDIKPGNIELTAKCALVDLNLVVAAKANLVLNSKFQ